MENTIIQCGRVKTEGDELFYKIRGSGKPILFIAPGGGNGDDYLALADLLAKDYKIITYDRRANSRSTRNFPNDFSVEQQSRDAVAVLNAASEDKAYVFGNSSGAVIALDLVTHYSDSVYSVIVHEAPVAVVHPENNKWRNFFQSCYDVAIKKGSSAGASKFFFGIEMPVLPLIFATQKGRKYAKREKILNDKQPLSNKEATDVLVLNELLPITSYVPDFEKLKAYCKKIIIGRGEYGIRKKTWYAEVAKILSEKVGCELIVCPTHHGSFMDKPEKWAELLKKHFK